MIKNKIEQLDLQARRRLSHAFDVELSQYVEFGNNEFIGVNIDLRRFRNLQILEEVGVWSYGKIIKGE